MDSRTRNVSRNIKMGIAYKVVTLLLPFVTRTLLLYLLGTTSLGASTLFTSILSFLSLAELGFGSAVVYTMYRPIADNDIEAIDALLNYYRKLYRLIGFVILLLGLAIMPFLPLLISGETPEGVNLYFLYLLYLLNSVISYFFAGYRQSLLTAYQRADVRDKIGMGVTIGVRVAEIIVIYLTRSLYAYVLVTIAGTIVTNMLTAVVTRRMYPEIECRGRVPDEVRRQIRKRLGGLFGTKLNSIVVHQADTLVISAFLGLTMVAQYGNYYYIMNAVAGFVMIIFSSMTASIGNKIATESEESVFELFEKINFINNWMVAWCAVCMVCLYRPFMILWVKEKLALPVLMSVLMAVYFYIFQIQRTILTFKDAGGMWYEDRYRPYVSMVFNVASNIILVQVIGIYGIVVSTILAFFISLPWCNYVVFRHMFHRSAMENLKKMTVNALAAAAVAAITYGVCGICGNGLIGLAEKALVCLVIPNAIFYLLYGRKKEFQYMREVAARMLPGRGRR